MFRTYLNKKGTIFVTLFLTLFFLTIHFPWSTTANELQPEGCGIERINFGGANVADGLYTTASCFVRGIAPWDIESLTINGPEGWSYDFDLENDTRVVYKHGWMYYFVEPDYPPEGLYHFILRDMQGREYEAEKNFTANPIDRVDIAAPGTSPQEGAYVNTTTPTLSWSPVSDETIDTLYYRVHIMDWVQKVNVYTSEWSPDTTLTLPEGILKSDEAYQWWVQVCDSLESTTANNCSFSEWRGFYTGDPNTPLIIEQAFVVSRAHEDHQETLFGIKTKGPAPYHISAMTVSGPDSFSYTFDPDGDYRLEIYSHLADGILPDGVYTFEVIDERDGNTVSVERGFSFNEIPIPEYLFFPFDHTYIETTTPTFSWKEVTDETADPLYYRIFVFDYKGNVIHKSPRSIETTAIMPPNILKPDNPYYWRVEVYDAESNPQNSAITSACPFYVAKDDPSGRISGQIDTGQSGYTGGNIFLAAFDKPWPNFTSLFGFTIPSDAGSYTLYNLPMDTDLYIYALWDKDESEIYITVGDWSGEYGYNPVVLIDGNSLTGIDITLDNEIPAASVSGVITCDNFQPGFGEININVYSGSPFNSSIPDFGFGYGGTTISEPGSYSIGNLPLGNNMWIIARWKGYWGLYSYDPLTLLSEVNTGIDIDLVYETSVGPGTISGYVKDELTGNILTDTSIGCINLDVGWHKFIYRQMENWGGQTSRAAFNAPGDPNWSWRWFSTSELEIKTSLDTDANIGIFLITKKNIWGDRYPETHEELVQCVDWDATQEPDWYGESVVNIVNQDENIHGDNDTYTSYYEAYFYVDTPGLWCFSTDSDDASEIVIDDQITACWYGGHGPADRWENKYEIRIYNFETHEWVDSTRGNQDGSYTYWGLSPGNYIIEATAPGYATEFFKERVSWDEATPVFVSDSEGASHISFTLKKSGAVSGNVSDPYGNPIPDLFIEAFSYACEGEWLSGTYTDSNGDYYLNGLPEGEIYIRTCACCDSLGYFDKWYDNVIRCDQSTPLTVIAGQTTENVNFILEPKGSIMDQLPSFINNGLQWLRENQNPDGSWGTSEYILGATELAALAFLNHGYDEEDPVVSSAVDFILSHVRESDGAISDDESDEWVDNYTTAIGIMALVAADKHNNPKEYTQVVSHAVKYLLDIQNTEANTQNSDISNPAYGGWGYGYPGYYGVYTWADLSNSQWDMLVLGEAKEFVDEAIVTQAEIDEALAKALIFVQRCQNRPATNDLPWAHDPSLESYNDGGFIYTPGSTYFDPEPWSYDTMTYAGIWGLFSCGVRIEDPRMTDALEWARDNFIIAPYCRGDHALYYTYYTMAKALTVIGEAADIVNPDWFTELSGELINMQEPDGSWINTNAGEGEGVRALTTSYALLALATRATSSTTTLDITITGDAVLSVTPPDGQILPGDPDVFLEAGTVSYGSYIINIEGIGDGTYTLTAQGQEDIYTNTDYSSMDIRNGESHRYDLVIWPGIGLDLDLRYRGSSIPFIEITNPDIQNQQADDLFMITWNDSDLDDNATIHIFFDHDTNDSNGLVGEITPEDGIQEDGPNFLDWDISGLAAGETYYIYATIADGNSVHSAWSPGTITISPDGMPGDWEANHGLDQYRDDTANDLDHDDMTNLEEYAFKDMDPNGRSTEPRSPDTDGDWLSDGFEFSLNNINILNPNEFDTDDDGIPDTEEDPDEDGYTNLQEYMLDSDPMDPNSEPPQKNLLFSDDFEADDFDKKWISGAECDEPDTITIVDGRIQSTANCNYIQSRGSFYGNLQIEVDVKKSGFYDYGCWDFYVELVDIYEKGVIRFDYNGMVGIDIGDCVDAFPISSSGPSKGKAVFTYLNEHVQFSFTNENGDLLITHKVYAGPLDASKIRIWLAGFPDSPRYIDNVKVYSFDELPEVIFYPDNGHYYQRIDMEMSWHDAKAYCESIGGYLATITSHDENDFVYNNLCTEGVEYWLGGTDELSEGDWEWITGEHWSFTNWAPGEPNDADDGEDYLMFPFDNFGKWNDNGLPNHGLDISFICEWGDVTEYPSVVLINPSDKAVRVPVDTPIRIQFSTQMDRGSVEENVRIEDAFGNHILGTFSWRSTSYQDDTLTFTSSQNLAYSQCYGVMIDGGCQDIFGRRLSDGYRESFFATVRAPWDDSAPEVITVLPYDGGPFDEGIPCIAAIFSRPLDPETVTADNVVLTGPGMDDPNDYSIEVRYDDYSCYIMIKPDRPFAAVGDFTVTLTPGITDTEGYPLASDYEWSFSRVEDPNPPRVTKTIPSDGAANIAPWAPIWVFFSENMDPDTVSYETVTLFDETTEAFKNFSLDKEFLDDGDHSRVIIHPVFGENWTIGDAYTLHISDTLADWSGNPLGTDYDLNFTAVDYPDYAPEIYWIEDTLAIREPDGSTLIKLTLWAGGANGNENIAISATDLTQTGKTWQLAHIPGTARFEYESPADEGLDAGEHEIDFEITDTVNEQTTNVAQNFYVFDTVPTLDIPEDGSQDVPLTPTFSWDTNDMIHDDFYEITVLDSPDPDTAEIVWKTLIIPDNRTQYTLTLPECRALAASTTYYWGVSAFANLDWEEGEARSPLYSFTTTHSAVCDEDDSGDLDIEGVSGFTGHHIFIPVRIRSAPNEVKAFGFEVNYDSRILEYNGFVPGGCVENLDQFDIHQPRGPGMLRIGGFSAHNAIPGGTDCTMVYLEFTIMECEGYNTTSMLWIDNLKDDMTGWVTSIGCFTCGYNGDLNGNGQITPLDALCALQTYLEICPTNCGDCMTMCCDVNRDGECTPADALCIFKKYLEIPSCLDEGWDLDEI